MTVSACCVKDYEDDDGVLAHDEENAIREAPDEDTADFRVFAQTLMGEWILDFASDGRPNFGGEFRTQARFAGTIRRRLMF